MSDRHEVAQIIKSRISIGELAKSQRSRIKCPFCGDGRASTDMQLYHPENRFKCFHCGLHGSVIDWYMYERGYSRNEFARAVEELGARLGLSVSEGNRRSDLLTIASFHFQDALSRNPEVLEYWESRGITSDTLYRARAGYCDMKVLQDVARFADPHRRVDWDALQAIRLAVYDKPFFEHHTVFPYRHWKTGKVMQMQGRYVGDLPNGETSRWKGMATQSTMGNNNITTMLWGEEELRNYWRRPGANGKTYAFLTEGVSDGLTLRQQETHTLSLIGNQNLYQHAWKLNKLDVLYLILDNDVKTMDKLPGELYMLLLECPRTEIVLVTLPNLGTDPSGNPIKQDVNTFFQRGGAMQDLTKIVLESPNALTQLIDWWADDDANYEMLLTLVCSQPRSERERYLDRMASHQRYTRRELAAAAEILQIPQNPLEGQRRMCRRR